MSVLLVVPELLDCERCTVKANKFIHEWIQRRAHVSKFVRSRMDFRYGGVTTGYFIRGQDILSHKARRYMRLQPSCPVGCVALYPTAIDFWKDKDAWYCAMIR